MNKKELIEELAAIQHKIWLEWMHSLFSQCEVEEVLRSGDNSPIGCLIIPKQLIDKWTRQIKTPYSELTEEEKQKDRDQVMKFIHLIK